MRHQIKIPLFLSFYLLLFLAIPGYGNAFQVMSLALIVMQNIATTLNARGNTSGSFKSNMSLLSIFLLGVIPLLSLANNFFNFEFYYVQYSILFFLAMLSIYFTVSTIEFRIIFNSFVYAAACITLTVLLTKTGLLRETLAISYDPVNGLNRFDPYNLHPNLVGHIFGGFAVAFFCTLGGKGSETAFAQMQEIVGNPPRATCAITARDVASGGEGALLAKFAGELQMPASSIAP